MKRFVDAENARPGKYGEAIADIAKKGICPFCSNQLKRFHKNPIVKKRYWIVTDNMYPYSPILRHILLIHIRHIEHISEISVVAWQELLTIIKRICKSKKVSGGTFLLRFGDTHFTGSSVSHLHVHLVQSNPEDGGYKKKKGLVTRIG